MPGSMIESQSAEVQALARGFADFLADRVAGGARRVDAVADLDAPMHPMEALFGAGSQAVGSSKGHLRADAVDFVQRAMRQLRLFLAQHAGCPASNVIASEARGGKGGRSRYREEEEGKGR